MDRLDDIAAFLAILDEGGISAAARKLGRSAPAVTRSLAALEAALGVRLIERTTRRMAPTEAGSRLAEHGRDMLLAFEDGMREVAGYAASPRGQLRITAPLVFGRLHVVPLVLRFLAAHPGVSVDLRLSDRNLDLLDEGIDAAIRIGELPDSSMVIRRLGEVHQVLVASPGYLAARGTPLSPADLADHDVVFFASHPRPPEVRLNGEAVRLSPRLLVSQAEAALDAAEAGAGIVNCLSYQAEAGLRDGRLVRLLRAFEPPPLPVQLAILSARYVMPRLRAFLDHAAQDLAVLPALSGGSWPEPAHPLSRGPQRSQPCRDD